MKKIVLLTIILFLSSPLCAHAIGVLAADGETCYLVVNPTGFNKTCVDTSTRASEALKGDTRLQTTENFRPNFYARPSLNKNGHYCIYKAGNTGLPAYYKWNGTSWDKIGTISEVIMDSTTGYCTEPVYDTYYAWLNSVGAVASLPAEPPKNFCQPDDPCADKAGTSAGWQLINYTEGTTPVPQNTCVDGCQVEASQINELPCSGSSCAATVQFTYTGDQCAAGDDINTQPEQPSACETQWAAKKNECGGAANIASFDWSSCTGECLSEGCTDAWLELSERCGGAGNIVNWDGKACTGTCVSDPVPNVDNGDSPPSKVETTTKTNDDGSSSTTTTSTYNIDDNEYTTTTTTEYDGDGNVTGTSTTESVGNSGEEPTYTSPDSWYTPTYDLNSGTLGSYLNYQSLMDVTDSFEETAIYQLPNLLLQCIGYVEGSGCEYPPTASVDFRGSIINKVITLDFSPFASVVQIMKFFFSIICIVGTAKAVMALFS
jgi:hypothetical protein